LPGHQSRSNTRLHLCKFSASLLFTTFLISYTHLSRQLALPNALRTAPKARFLTTQHTQHGEWTFTSGLLRLDPVISSNTGGLEKYYFICFITQMKSPAHFAYLILPRLPFQIISGPNSLISRTLRRLIQDRPATFLEKSKDAQSNASVDGQSSPSQTV
jgi:hypothetical protein